MFGRYVKISNITELNWLPVLESIDFAIARYAHKAINNNRWPKYLKIETVINERITRSRNDGPKIKHGEKSSFQEQARIVFNDLPKCIREQENFNIYTSEARKFYKDKAIARCLSL